MELDFLILLYNELLLVIYSYTYISVYFKINLKDTL